MRVIRKILNEKPDEFWTGKKFDSDINRALEIKGGRHAASEKRRALDFANKDKSVSKKTEKVVFSLGYEDATEDAAVTEKYQSKRNSKIKSESIDNSILKSDGNLDGAKVAQSMLQKHQDKKLEANNKVNKSVIQSRIVSPEKK